MRKIFLIALTILFATTSLSFAQSASNDKYKNYVNPTISMLTDYIFDAGLIRMAQASDVVEYMMIKDCTLYDLVKDDLFKQQQMMAQISQGQTQRIKNFNRSLKVRVYDQLLIEGYNFTTQSFDLAPKSAVRSVGMMDIVRNYNYCGQNLRFYTFPNSFSLKLNFPFSLVRIPFDIKSAKDMYQKLDYFEKYGQGSGKVVYTVFYLTIEGVTNTTRPGDYGKDAILLGQLDAVEIYTDKEYTKKIKELDYTAAY